MKFQFNVSISEKDYLDFNEFYMLKSPYGKKQIGSLRVGITIFYLICVAISLIGRFRAGENVIDSIIGIIPMLLLIVLIQVFIPRFFILTLKCHLKTLKKSGKMAYSSSSVIEFYEENFVEITDENKTEQKYSAIERISIIDNKMIYIHVNNVMAFILPISCFETREEYDRFILFIKNKCSNIDMY